VTVVEAALNEFEDGRATAGAVSPRRATVGAALREATKRIDRLDAEVLLADLLGISRLAMLSRLDVPVDAAPFAAHVDRRSGGEPVAYITGQREFWSLDLRVTPAVLIPRPDSETLIEAAMVHFGSKPVHRVLDLGTGSGALLLAALSQWPMATGVGVDISPAALAVAQANAKRLGFEGRAHLVEGGWNVMPGAFDLILCNPPYIGLYEALPSDVFDWEPHRALFAGADGLDDYRQLAPLIGTRLAAGGVACIEIGSTQADLAGALFIAARLQVALRHDLAGLPRCLIVTK
jgi:release factor glutamine methyltransferase